MTASSRPREPLSRQRLVSLAMALALLALGMHEGRRAFIRAFFADAPHELRSVEASSVAKPEQAVRVVLLDGLGHAHARTLPVLDELCARGQEFRVDTGFPTVSLPVQNVLWSGLTQQQSGLMYRIARRPDPDGRYLPRRVPRSIALAESHVDIITSFGFETTLPADEEAVTSEWRDSMFAAQAASAIASDRPLAFIHVLRIDEAGHASGADSPAYAEAAQEADDWLERWVPLAPGARWMVLADHGHLPSGGHAGRDANIPFVRACIFGPGIAVANDPPKTVHLVDLSRELFTWFDAQPAEPALGRPLSTASHSYRKGEYIPSPSWFRWLIAGACVLLGVAFTVWRRQGPGPWWLAAAYPSFALAYGVPTLSMPPIYPPLGLDAAVGAAAGWVILLTLLATTQTAPAMVVRRQLALPVALALAALVLCWGVPPLVPVWTAHASVLLIWCTFASAACALYCFGSALRSGADS